MRYLLLSLVVLGLASPGWAASGWFKGPSVTASPATRARPRQTVYWVRNDTSTATSPTLNVEDCGTVSTEWCLLPTDVDQNAGALAVIFLYGSADAAGTAATLVPYDADVDGGGIDHIGLTGDCGDDGDDSGTSLNNSKWYGWSITKPYFLVKQTVALEANKSIVFSLICHE